MTGVALEMQALVLFLVPYHLLYFESDARVLQLSHYVSQLYTEITTGMQL